MNTMRLLLAAAVLAGPAFARADAGCPAWVHHGDSAELQGPRGHFVLRGSPEALAALRRTLLFRCEGGQGPRPTLDVGPVEIEGVLHPEQQPAGGSVEMRLQMRAERLHLEVR